MDIWLNRPFSELYEKLKAQPRISQIERKERLDKGDFFSNFLGMGYPVIFKIDHLEKDIPEILKRVRGLRGIKIKIRSGDYADPSKYISERKMDEMPIQNFFGEMFDCNSDKLFYAGNFTLEKEVLNELGIIPPRFFPEVEFEPAALWAGGTGTITPLHKDGSKNFAMHLLGKKKWVLFPPRDADCLYMYRVIEDSDFAPSHVDLRNVDHEKFQKFKNAKSVSCEVKAGEILFLPEGWAHYVENLEPTIMVNYWHKNRG